jgi:hypothetical protein
MSRYKVLKAFLITLGGIVALGLVVSFAVRIIGASRLRVAVNRYESRLGSLDPASIERPPVPESENTVTWLQPGIGALIFLSGDQGTVGTLAAKPVDQWTPEQKAAAESVLERNAPALELLARARGLERSNWHIPYRDGATAKLPNLLAAMNAAKLLRVQSRLALQRGDQDAAISSVETLGALGRSFEPEPTLITLLIGTAIERIQLGAAHDLVESSSLTADQLERIEASLCRADLVAALKLALRGEAASVARDLHSQELLEKLPRILPRALAAGISDLFAASLLESHIEVDPTLGEPITAPLNATAGANPTWWGKLLDLYGPNVASAAGRALATSSVRDLARLALALRLSAIDLHRYPTEPPSLPNLAERDPLSGAPRAYSVRADGSVELRSTTTPEIVASIFSGLPLPFDSLFRWTLPPLAPRPGRN